MPVDLASFEPLSAAERLVWTRAGGAPPVPFARELSIDARPAAASALRGNFLAWLLCSELPRIAPAAGRLTLIGARIEGVVDLAGAKLSVTPRFVACSFRQTILLRDAQLVGFELLDSSALEIEADRLSMKGSMHVRDLRPADRIGLLDPPLTVAPPELLRRLILSGATIHGNLDLRSCRIWGIDLPAERPVALFADGVTINGNALLCDGFAAEGEVRLNGCKIGRNLDLSGARLLARERVSLSAAEAHISGDLLLCQTEPRPTNRWGAAFTSVGAIRLFGAEIEGELDCDGGHLVAPAFAHPALPVPQDDDGMTMALSAAGLVVHGGVWMGDGFHARGRVHLVNAKVGGDLQCLGGNFDHAGTTALEADGIEVSGTTFFQDGWQRRYVNQVELPKEPVPAQTNGFLSFNYADLKQGLYIDGLVVEASMVAAPEDPVPEVPPVPEGNCGLRAELTSIKGEFRLKRLIRQGAPDATRIGLEIDLRQAKADVLDDDRESWNRAAVVNVAGFQYEAIKGLQPASWDWRCGILDRHYGAPSGSAAAALPRAARARRFEPGPYLQLAKIMQRSGYDAAARRVRIGLEDTYTACGDFALRQIAWRYVLKAVIAYGYIPSLAFVWLLGWALISAVVFGPAAAGQLVPAKDAPPPLEFSALIYAVDTLVPIVDLHQKSNWLVQPPSCTPWVEAWNGTAAGRPLRLLTATWQSVVRLFGLLNPFIGWALTSLFTAAVTGLVRRGGDEG